MKLKVLLCILILCLCACCTYAASADDSELRFAIASDLHMQETNKDRVEANPLMYYQPEILSAFVSDLTNTDTDILILCGDITNSGRQKQHDLLLSLLREIEDKGIQVYVLPGNHDIGEVTPELFSELYSDFGYATAFSRDDFSLSYSLLIRNHMILMLDTNGYSGNRLTAFLKEPTLKWLEQQLSTAKKYGYPVLVVGHYPLITEQVTPFEGKEEAIRLLQEYGVQLYVCGHMHLRGVARYENLTELVVDQVVSYPCAYATVTIGENHAEYLPRTIDFAQWSAQNNFDDPRLMHFEDFLTALTDQTMDLTIDALLGDQKISSAEKEKMVDFFRIFRYDLSDGSLYKDRDLLKEHPGYRVFMQYAGNSTYGRWIPSALAAALPYVNGFITDNGNIRVPEN